MQANSDAFFSRYPVRRRCRAGVAFSLMLASALAGPAQVADARTYGKLFGFVQIVGQNWTLQRDPVVNWMAMQKRWKKGAPCDSAVCTDKGWSGLVTQVQAAGSVGAKILLANALMNDKIKHPYIVDEQNWGVPEYWASAFQFLKKSGDCEDFAIAKYMLLKAAGVPPDEMQVLSVLLRNDRSIAHAILVVYDGGKARVLDNRLPQVMDENFAALEYQPVMSMNDQVWTMLRPN